MRIKPTAQLLSTNQFSKLNRVVTSLTVLAVLFCAVNINTFAQVATATPTPAAVPDALTLTAIPTRLGDDGSLSAIPGETLQTSVRVRNASNQAVSLDTIAQDFIIDTDGETPLPVFGETSNRWSLASWMILVPQKKSLAPNETAQVDIIIKVPADALPGGHYAMISHQPGLISQQSATTDSASAINQRVGTLIYVTVEGPINEEAFIRDFKTPQFSEFGPIPFSFSVDNQSDIHINPVMTVKIFNLFGVEVESIQIEAKNIFPLSSRDFQGQWDRIWGIGPYTAKVTMVYGQSGSVAIATSRFWLLPISLVIAAVVISMSALVIFISIRRHLHHKAGVATQRVAMLEKKLAELEAEKQRPPDVV